MSEVVPSVKVSIQNHEGSVVFRNLILNQTVCGHHRFNFIWNIGDLKHDTHFQLDVIKNNIGSGVTIEINDNLFSGHYYWKYQCRTRKYYTVIFVQGESLTILR
ncbi:MAG: hypothetical protein IPP29_16920 [Bacteroidetes bacterium]|nr:hypothetical protein [Bacteroidota bacterium]